MAEQMRFDIAGRDVGAGATLRGVARDGDLAAASTRKLADAMDAQRRAAATSAAATLASAKADRILKDASDDAIRATVEQRIATEKLAASSKDAAGKAGIGALIGSGGIPGGGIGALIGAGAALSPILVTLGFGLGGLGAAAYGVAKPIADAAQKAGGLQKNLAMLDPEQQRVARGVLALGKQYAVFQDSLKPQVLGAFNQGLRIAGHVLHDVQPVAAATGTALNSVLASVDRELQSGTWQQFFGFMAKNAGPDVRLLGKDLTDLLQVLPPLLEDLQPLGRGLLVVSDDAIKAAGGVTSLYNAFQRDVPISNQHTLNATRDLDRWVVQLTNHIPGAKAVNDWFTGLQHGLTGTGAASGPASQGIAAVSGVAVNAQARLLALNKTADALSATWVSAPAKAAPATDAITRMAAAEQAAFRAAGPATDQITRLGTSAAIGAGRVKPLTDQITMTAHANEAASRSAGPLTDEISRLVIPAKAAAVRLADVAKAVTAINTAESTALATASAYAGDLVTTAGDAAALRKALRASHDEIGLHTAAQRASFGAANTYITDLGNTAAQAYKSGHGVDASIKAIRTGLPILDQAKTKNKAYWTEVKTLVGWLNRLRLEKAIHENVYVSGSGVFTVRPGKLGLPGGTAGGPFGAKGAYITQGTTPTADNVLARVSKGELIIPAKMVSAGLVDHLRGAIPGFAAGGLVPSYSGNVAGLVPWSRHDLNAAVAIFEQATAKATFAAMKAAAAAARAAAPAISGGGGPAAALFRRMYPAWASGALWAATNYVAMRESGWSTTAVNPSSGAAGVAQRIQGWAPFYQPGNAFQQDKWFHDYMSSRYGGPIGAAAHERAFNWYGSGLKGGIFTHPTVIGVGDQPERVDVTPVGSRPGHTGPLVHIDNFISNDATDPVLLGQRLSFAVTAASLGS